MARAPKPTRGTRIRKSSTNTGTLRLKNPWIYVVVGNFLQCLADNLPKGRKKTDWWLDGYSDCDSWCDAVVACWLQKWDVKDPISQRLSDSDGGTGLGKVELCDTWKWCPNNDQQPVFAWPRCKQCIEFCKCYEGDHTFRTLVSQSPKDFKVVDAVAMWNKLRHPLGMYKSNMCRNKSKTATADPYVTKCSFLLAAELCLKEHKDDGKIDDAINLLHGYARCGGKTRKTKKDYFVVAAVLLKRGTALSNFYSWQAAKQALKLDGPSRLHRALAAYYRGKLLATVLSNSTRFPEFGTSDWECWKFSIKCLSEVNDLLRDLRPRQEELDRHGIPSLDDLMADASRTASQLREWKPRKSRAPLKQRRKCPRGGP